MNTKIEIIEGGHVSTIPTIGSVSAYHVVDKLPNWIKVSEDGAISSGFDKTKLAKIEPITEVIEMRVVTAGNNNDGFNGIVGLQCDVFPFKDGELPGNGGLFANSPVTQEGNISLCWGKQGLYEFKPGNSGSLAIGRWQNKTIIGVAVRTSSLKWEDFENPKVQELSKKISETYDGQYPAASMNLVVNKGVYIEILGELRP